MSWRPLESKPLGELTSIGSVLPSVVGRLKVIPNWQAVAIRKAEGELENARAYGPLSRIERATKQLARARRTAGLE